jgi:hypothetical protein
VLGAMSIELFGMIANAKPVTVDTHKSGGALLAMNTEPAPAKDTACIKPIGMAERAATTEPEVLEAWAGDEAGCGQYMGRQWHRWGKPARVAGRVWAGMGMGKPSATHPKPLPHLQVSWVLTDPGYRP